MVTGVNSISGTMSSSCNPSVAGHGSPSSNGNNNSNGSLNGISLIEPVKRAGDNRRVSVTLCISYEINDNNLWSMKIHEKCREIMTNCDQ